MSNLLKGYFVQVDDAEREIDSNDLVEAKVQEEVQRLTRLQLLAEEGLLSEDGEEGFTEGLPISNIDALVGEDAESAVLRADAPAPGPASALDAEREELENIREEKENLLGQIEELNAQADEIIANASAEAESLINEAYENAKNEGYNAGFNEGMQAVESERAAVEELRDSLQREYEAQLLDLEPRFIDAITKIYEQIFKIDLSSSVVILRALLIDTILGTDSARNIIVHISREDYQEIIAIKEDILTETGMQEDNVEFVQDATLGQGACIVETENGVFDCSLGTELEELRRKLMILSMK